MNLVDCLFDCDGKDGVHGSDVEHWYGISGKRGGGRGEPTHNAAVDQHALGQDGCYRACWAWSTPPSAVRRMHVIEAVLGCVKLDGKMTILW